MTSVLENDFKSAFRSTAFQYILKASFQYITLFHQFREHHFDEKLFRELVSLNSDTRAKKT